MRYQQVTRDYDVFSWSVAGNETCVAVRAGRQHFAFDMGFAPEPVVPCDTVFISHGHVDHVGAIAQHMRKRHLNKFSKAVYYLPPQLVEPVRVVCKAFATMSERGDGENEFNCSLIAITPGSRVQLKDGWSVEAIETQHSVASQGYVLFRKDQSSGEDRPEIAYLGDSRFSVLKDAETNCPFLLSVRLLIMEATFLDRGEHLLSRAVTYGHTHLDELRQNASVFKSIETVYLMHFSARYNAEQIERHTRARMPSWLAGRIVPSLTAQRYLKLDY